MNKSHARLARGFTLSMLVACCSEIPALATVPLRMQEYNVEGKSIQVALPQTPVLAVLIVLAWCALALGDLLLGARRRAKKRGDTRV